MFCPNCKDEFRAGFTRCANCDVELVHELSAEDPVHARAKVAKAAAVTMPLPVKVADYCGFFSLDEARDARDQLRARRIASDIVIREPLGASLDDPLQEEFWLRVDAERYHDAHAILGDPAESIAAAEEDESFNCSECGGRVAAQESFCPGCGARFEES